MLTYWTDLDRSLSLMDQFRRRFDRVFDELDPQRRPASYEPWGSTWTSGFPRASLYDVGNKLELVVEVPGIGEKDIKVTLQDDRVTLEGQRRAEVPEGHSVHRRERPDIEFNRSFTLPTRVDPNQTKAELKNGVLHLELAKHPESQPREIPISIASAS